jgi:regulator of protease activity HflC (stomatin/prohibitin superfamily)
MTTTRRIGPWIHARSEASAVLAVYRDGKLVRSGRGLSAWFLRHGATALVEVPADDRDHVIALSATSRDFQAVSVQGMATWRAADPLLLGARLDFSVDPLSGMHNAEPVAQVEALIDGLLQSAIERFVAARDVAALLEAGVGPLQDQVAQDLAGTSRLAEIGVALAGFRLTNLSPGPELVRALRQPTLERLQQGADEATFARRAAAVEKEAAIARNETRARIRLEEERAALIARERDNERARAEAAAEAARIAAESEGETQAIAAAAAARARAIDSEAEAAATRLVEAAKLEGERARAEIAAGMPDVVVIAEALRHGLGAARIGTLNLGPDLMTQLGEVLSGAMAKPRAG